MSFAHVAILGNLTRDPEGKNLPDGTAVASFSLAVNRKYKDKESVAFIDCAAFGKTAENIVRFFAKGKPIHVTGELVQETWEAKDGGGKKSKLKVNVNGFNFLPGGKASEPTDDDGEYTKAAKAKAAAVIPNALGSLDQLSDADIPF